VGWEHFTHGADIGVRGSGASPGAAFEQAALALTAVIADPARVAPRAAFDFACAAPDLELLLADWLNALIYAMATRSVLFCRYAVALDGASLKATAWGEPLDRARHQPAVEVKGATYTALSVPPTDVGRAVRGRRLTNARATAPGARVRRHDDESEPVRTPRRVQVAAAADRGDARARRHLRRRSTAARDG
jgi:SHS2 domain-containing protein